MQDIISAGETVTLLTGMSDREFAQANLVQHLKDPGYIIQPPANGSADFLITEWYFDKTFSVDGVFAVRGDGFAGTILYDALERIQEEVDSTVCAAPTAAQKQSWHFVLAVLAAMRAAEKAQIRLPGTGPLGIICAENGAVLFLPEAILARSIAFRSQEDAARLSESWRQPVLPLEETAAFTAAAVAYTALSGRIAFPASTPERITEDFLDKNFIPLQYVAAVQPILAEKINATLKGKVKYRPTLEKLLAVLPQNIEDAYDSESKTAADSALKKFETKLQGHIGRVRFFRKHFTPIVISSVVALVLAAAGLSFAKAAAERPNTIGLTALQTTESFYASYNHLDTNGLDACITKKAGKPFSDMISSLYVISKVQSVYSQTQGFLTPAQWLLMPNREKESVFGLSQFCLNGKNADSNAEWFFNVNKDVPMGENGEKETVTASYYLFTTEGEAGIIIQKLVDTVTLEFVKDRWIITEITRQDTPVDFDAKQFWIESAKAADGSADEDFYKNYEWVPTDAEIEAAGKQLMERYSF